MCTIPVDLERKFEQQWAARFSRPIPSPEKHRFERLTEQLAPSNERKQKSGQLEPAGLRHVPAA
jgi:hypothetical protein